MLEVEVKYALPDSSALESALERQGAKFDAARRDIDRYYNAPDRDFATTDEAFRIRSIGNANWLTYKGPKIDRETKTRFEREMALADGPEAAREMAMILEHLGFRQTATVEKSRRIAHIERPGMRFQVSIDDVDGVGRFAEIETIAAKEQFAAAKKALLDLAADLGLKQPIGESYLRLLLNSRAGQPVDRMPMLVHTVAEVRRMVASFRQRGGKVGLVPTMGALHEGHAALVRRARAECEAVVVWIFVNPMQFGPNEDFGRYPRTLPEDVKLCGVAGADVVFAPAVEEVYPPNYRTKVHVAELGDHLCGPSRPGHFDGVATVVLKIFNMVGADRAYFGRKDAQQLRIVQQMVRDLNVPVEIVPCDTVREQDGLAMSSRNRYLDATQRAQAPALYQALCEVRDRVMAGERDASALRQRLRERIHAIPGAVIDYAEIVDGDRFAPVGRLNGSAVAALAVKLGQTRLIDNITLDSSNS